MKLKRLLVTLFVVFALVIPGSLLAQEVTVTGKIVDSKTNKPLPGATVKVKNTSTVATADADGNFTIKAPSAESVISITYVGYGVFETKAGNGNLAISLEGLDTNLDEVVVVGYGTQRLRNVTGAVSYVDPKKLQDLPVPSLADALRGQVPNLNVVGNAGRPGVMPTLNIRQQFNWGKDGGNPYPLIIIDDVIQIDPVTGLASLDRFNLLDISEVESITVLRDASAAIYGSRASQGAIVIKTKRGKTGPPRINYSGKFETNDAVSHGKVMNAYEYGIFANRFGRTQGWNADQTFSDKELERMKSLNYDWLMNDWERAGAMQHSLDVSGGSDRATYFVGGSYYTQGANLGTQDFKRYGFRSGSDITVTNGLKFTANLGAYSTNVERSFTKINVQDGSYALGGEQNDYSTLLHFPKYIPWIYNIGGVDRFVSPAMGPNKIANVSGNGTVANGNYYAWLANGSKTFNKGFGYNANFSLAYEVPFIRGLIVKGTYAINYTSSVNEQALLPVTLSRNGQGNKAERHLYDSAVWDAPVLNRSQSRVTYDNTTGKTEQINFVANYEHRFGDHGISAVFSGERSKSESDIRYQIYENPLPGVYNGASGSAGTLSPGNSYTSRLESGILSYLGRVSYDYKGKYLAQFIFRSDASSRFAPENYWGRFPGGSVGWVVSEESWFKERINWIDNLKIRASLAVTGNDNVKAWKWMQLYKLETDKGMLFGGSGGGLSNGITMEVTPNRDIRWDRTVQRNLGIDLSILRNRLSISVDQYYNTSTNVLTLMSGAINVPISVGGAFAEENYAGVTAWGTEFSINWRDQIAKKIDYSVNVNFGINGNRVNKYIDQPFDYESKMTTRREAGQSTFAPVWGFRTWKQTSSGDGILRTDADIDNYWAYLTDLANKSGIPGAAPKFLDITSKANLKKGMLVYEDQGGVLNSITRTYGGKNGSVQADEDYVKLAKNSRSYGFTTNLNVSYAGITLLAQISASWGGVNRLDYIKQGTSSTHSMWSHPSYLNDMYDPVDNPNGKYPNLGFYDAFGGANSDFFTLSSFRCFVRSLSIGYALPKSWAKAAHLESARLFIAGNNLWDFYNPYPNKYRNMYDAPNVGYPTLRTWALGVNLGF
ncbi:MAG: SusC/RagA family TonB-linked outer membrane protein [Chitinophagaceae bacterium]